MLRSTFFATGLFVTLWGVTFLFVDRMVLNVQQEPERESGFRAMLGLTTNVDRQKVLDPPDWAAFSLMSVGSVTMLYSLALPKKKQEG